MVKITYFDRNMIPLVLVRVWDNCKPMCATLRVVAWSELPFITVLLHSSTMASSGH